MKKKLIFFTFIGLFCILFLPKVNAVNTINTVTGGAYTIRYKNLNDVSDTIQVFQEVPLGTNSILAPDEYLLSNGSAYFTINGGYQPSKYYTFYVRFIGSENLDFKCNSNSEYTQQNNYSWKFSGGDTYTDFTSFRTSCDTTNNYLYVTFSIQAPASVGNSFVLYWDTLGTIYVNSIFTNLSNSNGTISFIVDKVESSDSDNSVIINQNQTIINQNQEQINQNNQIIEGQGKIFNSIVGLTEEFKNSQNATNDLISSEDIDSNDSFFSDFQTNNHGISSMITIPLQYINSWTNSCSPVTIPVLDTSFTIPCLSSTYKEYLGNELYTIIQIIVSGPLAYSIILYYIKSINHAQSPNDNRLEVTDL